MRDARYFQIVILGSLLMLGALYRDFSIRPAQVGLTFLAGILTQAACLRILGIRKAGYLSAVITCFGLSVLLRADHLWAHPAAAILAIGSKFVIRFRGKHVFNPANAGVIFAVSLLPGTWVSSGQWGHESAVAVWLAALGAFVSNRARQSTISWTFLAFYLGAIGARTLWLGHSGAVWLHQLTNGALLLFAFFMISDPMTLPNHPRARVLYAAVVTALAYGWRFELSLTNGPLWALFLAAPTVPLWDALWKARRFEWNRKGEHDASHIESTHGRPIRPAITPPPIPRRSPVGRASRGALPRPAL